jgi:hypothetical protein
MTGVERRPRSDSSLQHGVPRVAPGTLLAQSIGGGITVGPKEGRTLFFGRQAEEVHVCVGGDDLGVSRMHGVLHYERGQWWARNVGRRPLRLPSGDVYTNADPVPLREGYTAMFVAGHNERQHLLEIFVVGADGDRPRPRHDDRTHSPSIWPLGSQELLAVIVLGQRYLRHEPHPQPLTWVETARTLSQLDPGGGWTPKSTEHRVGRIRERMRAGGVAGLVSEEVSQPIGNQLNDNMLRELVRSATLVPTDLARLDAWADGETELR